MLLLNRIICALDRPLVIAMPTYVGDSNAIGHTAHLVPGFYGCIQNDRTIYSLLFIFDCTIDLKMYPRVEKRHFWNAERSKLCLKNCSSPINSIAWLKNRKPTFLNRIIPLADHK